MSYPKSGSIGATPTLIKAGPGRLTGFDIYNSNVAVAYLQLFDAASVNAVTLGTTVPIKSIGIPGAGRASRDFSNGMSFANGLVLAISTTRLGLTGPVATVDYNFLYE